MIGQQATVIEILEPHKVGRVKIRGEEWPAIVTDNNTLQKSTLVTIIAIQGNKLQVKKS